MEISLSGRTAIVTGGSKGLGYAIATRFVNSGADVMICARGREALDAAVKSIGEQAASAKGGNARGKIAGCAGDVAKPDDVKRIYTDLAVMEIGPSGVIVHEIVDGLSREELQKRTGAPLTFAPACKAINAPPLADVQA